MMVYTLRTEQFGLQSILMSTFVCLPLLSVSNEIYTENKTESKIVLKNTNTVLEI